MFVEESKFHNALMNSPLIRQAKAKYYEIGRVLDQLVESFIILYTNLVTIETYD